MTEVKVGALANGGRCVAHVAGKTVFVRGAIPGETVRIQITDENAKVAFADVVEVVDRSEFRVEPPCKHAERCGGCDFQHVSFESQSKMLTQVLHDTYRRIGNIELTAEVQSMGQPFGWRTRMSFAVDDQNRACMHSARSHQLVPIEECLIAHGELPKVWRNPILDEGNAFAAVSSTGQSTTDPLMVLTEKVLDRTFEHVAGGFWQVHPNAAATLVNTVMQFGEPENGQHVIDLYSGAGLFTAFLAESVGATGSVLAIEQSPEAALFAQENLSDFSNVELICAPVEAVELGNADLIVLDPPRAGAKKAIPAILEAQPSRIVYVSCDLATGARDLRQLIESEYKLADFAAFALFPMTAHVETVALLEIAEQ